MKICEKFISIQGEGRFTGRPSIFIRLHGCNLRCNFCDSKFSFEEDYINIDEKELADEINNSHIKNVVITGGEPLLQHLSLKNFLYRLYSDVSVEIETNGTIPQTLIKHNLTYNVSPKLQFENTIYLPTHDNYIVKFVDGGSDEYRSKILDFIEARKNKVNRNQVFIMPEGKTIKEMEKLQLSTIDFCMKHNFNYCHRVHVTIWNGMKGV